MCRRLRASLQTISVYVSHLNFQQSSKNVIFIGSDHLDDLDPYFTCLVLIRYISIVARGLAKYIR